MTAAFCTRCNGLRELATANEAWYCMGCGMDESGLVLQVDAVDNEGISLMHRIADEGRLTLMHTTDTERMVRCGYCLTENPLSDHFLQHGAGICATLSSPENTAGAQLLEVWHDLVAGGDAWTDIVEAMAYDMSSDYRRLDKSIAEGGEIAQRAEDRMWQIEERATKAMMVNFVKRLCYTSRITVEELMS